ncbi:MAG: Hypothetical protein BHV28_09900 [Candidatus Tokpelaia hoelldobleri]|uniref:Uncharacterized protein n=1 Tax=Candidatus Tokpelaia hoelldobleri TaxID=1902579 RepID=A0A1U9JUX9_9HYPH|nr:MAG: Hypothetical protein BHV28_09900 [Candidatus Tokpelaia hoelldoblerii]
MTKYKKYIGSLIGVIVMVAACYFLYRNLSRISLADIIASISRVSNSQWGMAAFFALLAYIALAEYDRIALSYLGKKLSWVYITLCSFTTYALSHNIGASVFSGAVVRYRAYSRKGLSNPEIAVLVGLCSFTFLLGVLLLTSLVLIVRPDIIHRIPLKYDIPEGLAIFIGCIISGFIALYVIGSIKGMKPLKIGSKFQLTYPRPGIVIQQLIIGPLELLGAAGIIYAVLPEAGNPGFLIVLGVFLASFSATLVLNAPAGGLGVLELVFTTGMAGMKEADVIAALIVFRLLYLIIPLIISLFIVGIFEASQWRKPKIKNHQVSPTTDNHIS